MASSRCLVLGGGGFIGTNLCRHLVGHVELVRAFGRRVSCPEAMAGVEWIPGDFRDSASLGSAITGCDTVFHLITGSTPASSNLNKAGDLLATVIPTIHLLDACREHKVRRVVFASSGGTVYGPGAPIPTGEDAILRPISAYGVHK